MLISLHLKNFRRHESLNLSFAEGLNGLFGKNYAGKLEKALNDIEETKRRIAAVMSEQTENQAS